MKNLLPSLATLNPAPGLNLNGGSDAIGSGADGTAPVRLQANDVTAPRRERGGRGHAPSDAGGMR